MQRKNIVFMRQIDWNNTGEQKTEKLLRISREQQQIRLGVCYRPRSAVEAFQADEPDAKTHIRLQLALPYSRKSIKTRRLARSLGAGKSSSAAWGPGRRQAPFVRRHQHCGTSREAAIVFFFNLEEWISAVKNPPSSTGGSVMDWSTPRAEDSKWHMEED